MNDLYALSDKLSADDCIYLITDLIVSQETNIDDIAPLLRKKVEKYIKEDIIANEQDIVEGLELDKYSEDFAFEISDIRFPNDEENLFKIITEYLSNQSIPYKPLDEYYNPKRRLDQKVLSVIAELYMNFDDYEIIYNIIVEESEYISFFISAMKHNGCLSEQKLHISNDCEDGFRLTSDYMAWKWVLDKDCCKKQLSNNSLLFINNNEKKIEDFEKNYQALVSAVLKAGYPLYIY